MAVVTWKNSGGGNFDNSGSLFWSNNAIPAAGDTAALTSTFLGADYSVNVINAGTVAQVNIGAANAELAVEALFNLGSINLTAGTLAVVSGATITGHTTIADGPSTTTIFQGGTLDGVTWKGTLGLTGVTQSSLLDISTSLNVLNAAGNGPGVIAITGPGATMNIDSSMTLNGTNGNLLINMGTGGSQSEFLSVGSGVVLTLGSLVTLSQTAAGSDVWLSDVSTSGTLVNNGTLSFTSGAGSSAEINPNTFVNNGLIQESGGILNGESLDITALTSFTNSGLIQLSNFGRLGITSTAGSMVADGTISASGTSVVDLNTNATGTGVIALSNQSTADIFNYSGTVQFLDATGTLALEQPSLYTGTIVGMSSILPGTLDVIDLLHTNVTTILPYGGNALGGTLTAMNGTNIAANIVLAGNYVGQQFGFTSDGNSGTNVFLGCFAAGTRILTEGGEVNVESLHIGEMILAHTGDGQMAPHPVVWIGRRHVDCRRHTAPRQVWPVRVRAGAFGPDTPRVNLWLSPDHAVYVRDVLIPIRCLINGTSVAQVPVDEVTYYHVELPRHGVLLAEGLPAESYLNTGDGADFARNGQVTRLFPAFSRTVPGLATVWEAKGCAPLIMTGPKLTAARAALDARAMAEPPDRAATLTGT